MNTSKRHRFPPDIISYAVWLYYRFNLSHRDIEDLLAQRGITVSREAIRLWCILKNIVFRSYQPAALLSGIQNLSVINGS
jgi:transposase-like protein